TRVSHSTTYGWATPPTSAFANTCVGRSGASVAADLPATDILEGCRQALRRYAVGFLPNLALAKGPLPVILAHRPYLSPAASASLFASEANMSTDTTVVLVPGARLVRCTLPILVGLLALAAPLVGQARPGHFYHVNYYQVRPGQEKAYDSALVNVVTPVFDELVKRKAVVSYLLLTKIAGSGENTHVVIVEVAT